MYFSRWCLHVHAYTDTRAHTRALLFYTHPDCHIVSPLSVDQGLCFSESPVLAQSSCLSNVCWIAFALCSSEFPVTGSVQVKSG